MLALGFVLDALVTIRWALADGSSSDRNYADAVLASLSSTPAHVPVLWCTEIIHLLRGAETAGKIGEATVAAFVYQLNQLPINTDGAGAFGLMLPVAATAREFNVSGYDAQYLELARRLNLPFTALDKDLRKTAKKAGVSIYLT